MIMADSDTTTAVMPSAAPSEAELAQWKELPRDEQVRRLKMALSHPDCDAVGDASMAELRERGRALAATRRDG